MARRIGNVLEVPHTEIDGLFHGPGWVPRVSFLADVERFTAVPGWVTEWQYAAARPLLAERADTLVWLDLSRGVVMRQVVRRTVHRRLQRELLWHDVEPALWTVVTERDHIVRWAWRTHAASGARVAALARARPALQVVRLRDQGQIDRWLAGPLLASARQEQSWSTGCADAARHAERVAQQLQDQKIQAGLRPGVRRWAAATGRARR